MNKSFKEKVKENRGKIIAGVIFGVTIMILLRLNIKTCRH